jgi:hypothetical protein
MLAAPMVPFGATLLRLKSFAEGCALRTSRSARPLRGRSRYLLPSSTHTQPKTIDETSTEPTTNREQQGTSAVQPEIGMASAAVVGQALPTSVQEECTPIQSECSQTDKGMGIDQTHDCTGVGRVRANNLAHRIDRPGQECRYAAQTTDQEAVVGTAVPVTRSTT